VQRVAVQIALHGRRVFHELRIVERADGFVMGNTRRHHLAPAGIAGHEMRFNKARGDLQVRLRETAVDHNGNSAAGLPKVHVGTPVAGKMVFDADGAKDLSRPHNFS